MPGDHITINDRETFPAKLAAIRGAADALTAAAKALTQLESSAGREAGSFTRDGSLAPIYAPLIDAVKKWSGAAVAATSSVTDNVENAVATAEAKFRGIVATDERGRNAIDATTASDGPSNRHASPSSLGDNTLPLVDAAAAPFSESLASLQKRIGADVGIASTPLFGDDRQVHTEGDLQTGDAWSTMKAPIAAAVMRENGGQITPDITAAIEHSDNAAADRLWASLGDAQTAAGKVEAVLRDAGDTTTQVNAVKDSQFSAYGQTQWALSDQLKFAGYLETDPAAAPLLTLMSHIETDQQWGLGDRDGAAFKGGWGPSGANGEYLTRQFGVVDGPGGPYAVAIAVAPNSGAFADSTAAITEVSRWLHLR